MNIPRTDFHIHTTHLKCANETMELPAILRECEQLGIMSLGITDHLNHLDQLNLHKSIRQDIEKLRTGVKVYFGVELNFTAADGNFPFSPEIKDQYGFQFALGGIHTTYLDTWDPKKLVEIQHRHHLKTCQDPLVDVLVHPYWFGKGEFDNKGWPWFDSMQTVPPAFARELAQTARETHTAIEINGGANLDNPGYSDRYKKEYLDYLAIMAEEGACFALGSDAHDINRLCQVKAAWQAAEKMNLNTDHIWHPAGEPMTGGVKT